MIALLLSAGVAMVSGLIGSPLLIRWLKTQGIGQQVRDFLTEEQQAKAGTPTMGGVVIVGAAIIGYLVAHVRAGAYFSRAGLFVMTAVVGAAVVGFADDWIKVKHRRSLGLNKRAKFGGQIFVATAFAAAAIQWASVHTQLSFTRHDSLGIDLGRVGWVALAIVMVLATTNAVNFTDGMDGLAAGASTFAFSALAMIGFWQFRHVDVYAVPQALDLALVAVAFTGACTGFLWWNAAPAKLQMGDTGSLAIGAGLASLALVMNVHLLLPIFGGLFVLETLSVMIQIGTFRYLNRRRIFRMAPIHYHFELMGWPETTVVVRFWILAGLCTAFSLAVFYADFIHLGGID